MKVYTKGQVVICPRCGERGTRRLEKTCCGRPTCKVCGGSKRAHGPYWFIYHYGKDENGTRQRHRYIGKIWPEKPSEKAIKHMVETGIAKSREEAIKHYQEVTPAPKIPEERMEKSVGESNMVALWIPKGLIDKIDELVKRGLYPNCDEAVMFALHDLLKREE